MNDFKIKPNKVVFLGYNSVINYKIDINIQFKIKTQIICSKNQYKQICDKVKNFSDISVVSGLNRNFFRLIKVSDSKTLFISHALPWILKSDHLKRFFKKKKIINIHHSRLPYDRGRAVTSWKILKNDKINSVTFHLMDQGIDTGPILFQVSNIYSKLCKKPIDYDKETNELSVKAYKIFIQKLLMGTTFKIKPQPSMIGRYNCSLKSSSKDSLIDWNLDEESLYRFINAFDDPYNGAKTKIAGKKVRIKDIYLHGGETTSHPSFPGVISRNDKNWIVVSTKGSQSLIIKEVLYNKKNIINKLRPGMRFK